MPLNIGSSRTLLYSPARSVSDSFDRASGAIGGGWQSGGATWTVSGNKAINTPSLGSELIVNGTFAADTDWTKGSGWTIAAGVATKGVSAGSNSLIEQNVLAANTWYRCVYTVASLVDGVARPYFNASYAGGGAPSDGTYTVSMYSTGAAAGVLGTATTTTMNLDNVSFKALTLSQLFLTTNFGVSNAKVSANGMVVLRGNRMGVVLNLDDPANPQNFVLGVHDGGPLAGQAGVLGIYKCVGGVMSQVSADSTAYVAGATISLRKSSTTYTLAYNGTDAVAGTVADAGIINNTYHGLFGVHESGSFDHVAIVAN